MLEFLQGFAYGLFLTCIPWFLVGMVNPSLALPTEHPNRVQVGVRYWLLLPFIAFLLWLTSLWGGFGPSLLGWLSGVVFIAVELPVERRVRRWWKRFRDWRRESYRGEELAREQARRDREAREAGSAVLDPDHPPQDADDVIMALCHAKQALRESGRDDLATQADRLYSRYRHVSALIESRFDASELTFERSRQLIIDVCLGAVDTLHDMASQASSVAGVDSDFVRRRLEREGNQLTVAERVALKRRLQLVDETERHLRDLSARNESALTALDDTAVAMARLDTGRTQAKVSADQALAELRRFIDRAPRYGRHHRG
ncbi:cobyrinic acid a,c-diamide synthase [Aidingimonas lacisalsi]|uniref:cobyrinic acid a,c-diamide synthase n=1 Tax=Aidingimonas lacisalsi TaxID=2604086 RepID=UPI0011D2B692|nr:cobyrinic acid a,c-diamide synthase [Aidingimonas lacisalsi]